MKKNVVGQVKRSIDKQLTGASHSNVNKKRPGYSKLHGKHPSKP